ncbi:MAG: SDR family oxidoreductase [Firmicutes bacterium]|jgi:gluconate 5-dehydrogenase|nr:SDR family oxidoreductase [Bacillota bacterium]
MLKGKRVIVTGATSGLGLAMAEALLRAGASVAISARPTPRLQSTVQRFQQHGFDVEGLPMDVRDEKSVEDAKGEILRRWPAIDMVVNNAGLGMRTVNPDFLTEPMPFFQVSPEKFDAVLETNLRGYFLVSRAFAPVFIHQGGGRFVNISMNHETMVRRGFVPYGPSRAGAESLSRIMAEDLKPFGITVNVLLPGGATLTGMIPDEVLPEVRQRLLVPAIMGPPIVFLASDRADGITGERIEANHFEEWCQARGIIQ